MARYIREHEPWAVYLKPFGEEKSLQSWLYDWQGDGIIAAVTDAETGVLADMDIPVVDVIGVLRKAGVPLVHTNDRSVGRLGAEHLLKRGFRNFGFVENPEHAWSTTRRAAFVEIRREHDWDCQVYQLPYPQAARGGPMAWEQQQRGLQKWISSLPKPTGVMCSTDLLAQQFLEACLRSKISVPEEIAVIGADNDEPVCRTPGSYRNARLATANDKNNP